MKQKLLLYLGIMATLLCGCSFDDKDYPEYFTPIVHELETSMETAVPVMDVRWDSEVDYFDEYIDKIYTCSIHNVDYEFNLEDELAGAKNWYWDTAGVFSEEGENPTYICLHDYTIMYEDHVVQPPQLLLIEFSTEKPEEYQIWPYTVEPAYTFGWDVICYRLQNHIYIAGENDLAAISLDTKEYHLCNEEYAYADNYVKNKFGEEPYHIFYFRAILEQDDVIVYSAEVDESFDELSPIGMFYVAYKDNKPIAHMYVDLTKDNFMDDIEVEVYD